MSRCIGPSPKGRHVLGPSEPVDGAKVPKAKPKVTRSESGDGKCAVTRRSK